MVYIQYIKGERIALVTPDFHGRHHPEVLFWLLFDRREEGVGATDQQTLQFPAPCAKQTKGYGRTDQTVAYTRLKVESVFPQE